MDGAKFTFHGQRLFGTDAIGTSLFGVGIPIPLSFAKLDGFLSSSGGLISETLFLGILFFVDFTKVVLFPVSSKVVSTNFLIFFRLSVTETVTSDFKDSLLMVDRSPGGSGEEESLGGDV